MGYSLSLTSHHHVIRPSFVKKRRESKELQKQREIKKTIMFGVNEKMRGTTTISLAAVLLMAVVFLDLKESHNYCKATTTPDHLVISINSNSSWCDGQHCHIEDEVEVWSETQTLFMVDLETSRMLAGENTPPTLNALDAGQDFNCGRPPAYYPCVDSSGNKRKVPPKCDARNRDPTCPIYRS